MKKLISAILVAGVCFSGVAMADNAQQNRMADCNKQATGKKGDDRKSFMKACLSGTQPADTPASAAVDKNGKPLTAQQQKMKDCVAQNKGKKGADYKKGLSACLKS